MRKRYLGGLINHYYRKAAELPGDRKDNLTIRVRARLQERCQVWRQKSLLELANTWRERHLHGEFNGKIKESDLTSIR
jgi:hypothetical protein